MEHQKLLHNKLVPTIVSSLEKNDMLLQLLSNEKLNNEKEKINRGYRE